MIAGEYAVLFGADSFAVPTFTGQKMQVITQKHNSEQIKLNWKSFDKQDQLWFNEDFIGQKLIAVSKSAPSPVSNKLERLLSKITELSENSFQINLSYDITSWLEFDRNWGFGSSSSLIANLAKYADLNDNELFELFQSTENGSGYDVFISYYNKPLKYRIENEKPSFEIVTWNPEFAEDLALVYSGSKQFSASEVENVRSSNLFNKNNIASLNEVTNELMSALKLNDFEKSIQNHEQIVGEGINRMPLKNKVFSDFKGQIKSLGAWGGDFFMATRYDNALKYFNEKGFEVFRFKEIVNLNTSN